MVMTEKSNYGNSVTPSTGYELNTSCFPRTIAVNAGNSLVILSNVFQAALKEILHPLRLLKSKTRLQFADVQYILFTSPVLRASEAAILLVRLLLVFLCDALGGHLVFRDVVQMASRHYLSFKKKLFS